MFAVAMELGKGFVSSIGISVDQDGYLNSDLVLDPDHFMRFEDYESALEVCYICLILYPDNDFMVQLVSETILKIPDLLSGFFPAEVVTALLLIFTVVVIYKILGREG